MKTLLLSLAIAGMRIHAQTAVFPGGTVTDAQLGVARNSVKTKMAGGITASSTSIVLASSAGIVPNMMLSIGPVKPEIVWVCGVSGNTVSVGRASCPNIDGRGFDSTTAVAHVSGEPVANQPVAWDKNALVKEIEAIEANASNAGALNVPAFIFSPQTPGVSLVAHGVDQVVPVSPCAWMAAGQDVYLSGGTGAAEAIKVTATSCTGGTGSGTITITPANSHTGAWTVQSATCGLGQAIAAANAVGGGTLIFPAHFSCTATGTARVGAPPIALIGPGANLMAITMNSSGIPWLDVGTGTLLVDGITIYGASGFANVSTNIGIQLSGSTGGLVSSGNNGAVIRNSHIENFATGINSINAGNLLIQNNQLIDNNQQIYTSIISDGDAGLGSIINNNLNCFDGLGTVACGANIQLNAPGGIVVRGNNILGGTEGILLFLSMGTVSTSGTAVTLLTPGSFLTAMVGHQVAIGPATYTVASVTDATHMTLTGSAGTQTTPWFYYPTGSSEIHIEDNTIDQGGIATAGIDIETQVSFSSLTIQRNLINKFVTGVDWIGIQFNASAGQGALVDSNVIYSADNTGTQCIRLSFFDQVKIGDGNICRTEEFGVVAAFGSTTNIDLRDVTFYGVTTPLSLAAATGWRISTTSAIAYSVLSTMSAASGSKIQCSDCDTPASAGATCSSAGDKAGAEARYNRGAWHCY